MAQTNNLRKIHKRKTVAVHAIILQSKEVLVSLLSL